MDRVKLGKKSRKKGTTNQAKSVQYILKHPEIYGIEVESVRTSGNLYSHRVHSMINSSFPTPHKDLFTLWDIITMPDKTLETYESNHGEEGNLQFGFIYLIQVKSKHISQEELNKLAEWKVPFYVKKEIHVWKDNEKEPVIYKI